MKKQTGHAVKSVVLFMAVCSQALLSSCATVHYPLPPDQLHSFAVTETFPDHLINQYSPVFIIEEPTKSYNRIGSPKARYVDHKKEEIYIDSDSPAIYYMKQKFTTPNGSYTNLIYRVHFQKIPFSLYPFYLNTGKNTGMMLIVTLNEKQEPVLLTAVNTCGCYLAIIPTSYTPEHAFPDNWPRKKWQWIYGEYLPALLNFHGSDKQASLRPIVLIRSDTHRVKALWVDTPQSVEQIYKIVPIQLVPMEDLEKLPLNGTHTSFFETNGPRLGYVKNSHKPLERLLMSWWTFDWRIGEDKMYEPDKKYSRVFYTSVKFWARQESDMRNFATFLEYWGWKL